LSPPQKFDKWAGEACGGPKQLEEALGSLASFEVLTGESGEDRP
jgi:hypothetical protein